MLFQSLGAEWHISESGVKIVSHDGLIKEKNELFKNALNSDLKEIGTPVLSQELLKNKSSKVVLQIQKIRNVAAPKSNENSQVAPRMLKITLSDGFTCAQAIETSFIPNINQDKTPPGSKLLIDDAHIKSGFLLLNEKNCKYLGGKVPHLYEKWEVSKNIQVQNRQTTNTEGPPAWVNFGSKITSNETQNFKSLSVKEAAKDSEFEEQRKEAIAVIAAGAVKKQFGGRTKINQDDEHYDNKNTGFFSSNKKINKNLEKDKGNDKSSNKCPDEDVYYKKPSNRILLSDFFENHLSLKENRSSTEKPKNISSCNEINSQNSGQQKSDSPPKNTNFSQTLEKKNYSNNNRNNVERNKTGKFLVNSVIKNSIRENNINNKGLERESLNSNFATRSLRQHLNLNTFPSRNNVESPQGKMFNGNMCTSNNTIYKVGDQCLAKYWEDGKFYDAIITAVTDKTYVVKFTGYGNIEEVMKSDCLPITSKRQEMNFKSRSFTNHRAK